MGAQDGSRKMHRGADVSLALTTSRCILFDGENILFDSSFVTYIYVVLIFQGGVVVKALRY